MTRPSSLRTLALLPAMTQLVAPIGLATLVLPALLSPWLGLAIASVGPLTLLLGPRLPSGFGRARTAHAAPSESHKALPAELVELARTREQLAALSRTFSERLLALGQRIDPLEQRAQPRPEDVLACATLTRDCLHAWRDAACATTRFGAAHRALLAHIEQRRHTMDESTLSALHAAIAELLRSFDRFAHNQQHRARRLLAYARTLAHHSARCGIALVPDLQGDLADFAAQVGLDATPLPRPPPRAI